MGWWLPRMWASTTGASDREMMAGELKGGLQEQQDKQAYQRSVDMLAVVWRTK